MSNPIAALIALAEQLPKKLKSDWKDTNHFELTCSVDNDYWWLTFEDGFPLTEHTPCETQKGQRIGLLMDIAEALKAAEPELRKMASEQEGMTWVLANHVQED